MKWLLKLLDKLKLDSPFFPIGLFVVLMLIATIGSPDLIWSAIFFIFSISYIWFPPLLIWLLLRVWKDFKQTQFIAKQEHVLFELNFPQHIEQGPEAMEVFLNALYNTGRETTFIKRFFMGQVRPWWSFEIASFDETVHFYIRSEKGMSDVLVARLKGAYPTIDIIPVSDYTYDVEYSPETKGLFGHEYDLKKPDPYPIKTYLDKEISDIAKEKSYTFVDPLMHIVNFFGSQGKGHALWYQIIVRGHKSDQKKGWFGTTDRYVDEGRAEVKKILDLVKDKNGTPDPWRLTASQSRVVDAIDRSLGKSTFECGIRALYIVDKDKFDGSVPGGLINLLRPFNDADLNGFSPTRFHAKYDYPWQDFWGIFKELDRRRLFRYYRERAYFYPPYRQRPMIFTSEELATLFHPPQAPGNAAASMTRVGSKRAMPPTNLPV